MTHFCGVEMVTTFVSIPGEGRLAGFTLDLPGFVCVLHPNRPVIAGEALDLVTRLEGEGKPLSLLDLATIVQGGYQ